MHLAGGTFVYIAGLAMAPYLDDNLLYRIVPFLLAAGAWFFKGKKAASPLLFLLLFAIGFNQYHLATAPDRTDRAVLESVADRRVVIEGRVVSITGRPEGASSLDLESVRVIDADRGRALNGKARIFIEDHDDPLRPGTTVRLLTRLKEPGTFSTPGAFDYRRYLQRRNIVASGYCRKASHIAVLQDGRSMSAVERIRFWRGTIRDLVNRSLPEDAAPLANALAIGDRGALPDGQRKLLAGSGIAHLFAISGLHLGLVAAMLYVILRPLYLRTLAERTGIPARRILPLLLLPPLFGYMILTGSAISAQRSLAMISAAALLCVASRKARPVDLLTAAALLILLFDPLALFEPSFQLSVAGTGGIILFLPLWQPARDALPKALRYPLSLVAITLSASLATLPFVLMHFHILAPASPLLNLLAVPLVGFVLVPLSLLGTMTTLASPPAAAYIFKVSGSILMPFIDLVEALITYAPLRARTIFLPPTALFATGLLVAIACLYRNIPMKRLALAGLAASLALCLAGVVSRNDAGLTVTALDVGQGDATLLQTADGSAYLIDGGGLYGESFDTGERLVAPALGRLGIRRLRAVILSHDHPDHRKGLAYILEHFPVDAFWSASGEADIHPDLLTPIRANGIPVRTFPAGWHAVDAGGVQLQIFVPGNASTRLNDHSLVLYARLGGDGLLLTGDLEKEGIAELAAAAAPGPVTLIKLPHHGSARSDPATLLAKHRPQFAFCSVGAGNRYNLPSSSVLDSLEKASVTLLRTDRDGTFRMHTSGDGWSITHWKKGLFR